MTAPPPDAAAGSPRRSRVLTVSIVAALVLVGGIGAVIAHQATGGRGGRPAVVQLDGPTTSPTSTGRSAVASASGSTAGRLPQTLAWRPCGGQAQCATLAVPLDWSGTDPAARGTTIPMAVIRYRATGPAAQRIGSLVVNPGGPGGSGVAFVRDDVSIIPAAVRARFDIVGFDPRGTGASDPVTCLSGPQQDTLYAAPPYPTSAAQTREVVALAQGLGAACLARTGDELRHLGTPEVARDLDALRVALGEQQLTYLGYSYGTYLGAAYARLFPTHIRAFVLDGAIDPTQTGTEMLAGQAGGFEGAFDAFAAWCAGNNQCGFGSSLSTAAQVEAAYRSLQAQVQRTPLPGSGSRVLTAGLFLEGTLDPLYSKQAWPVLGTALELAQTGSGVELLQLSDELLGRNPDGSYDPEDEANAAINCLDHTYPTVAQTPAFAAALAARYPIFGRALGWSGLDCAVWPVPAVVDTAPVTAPGAPPILVIATTRDPATPYAGGVALARELSSGVLLSNNGDGHTAYRASGSGCVIGIVDAYLFARTAPSRSTGAHC